MSFINVAAKATGNYVVFRCSEITMASFLSRQGKPIHTHATLPGHMGQAKAGSSDMGRGKKLLIYLWYCLYLYITQC